MAQLPRFRRTIAASLCLVLTFLAEWSSGQTSGVISNFPNGVAISVDVQGEVGMFLGGDAACQMPVSGGSSQAYWTLGDCFIGDKNSNYPPANAPPANPAAGPVLAGNVLCVVNSTANGNQFTYYFRGTVANPQPFFPDYQSAVYTQQYGPNLTSHYWPSRSFLASNGYLFIVMQRVLVGTDNLKNANTGGPNVRTGCRRGSVVARVKNTNVYPWNWAVEYFELTPISSPPLQSTPGLNQDFIYPLIGNEALPVNIASIDYLLLYGNDGSDNNLALRLAFNSLCSFTTNNFTSGGQTYNAANVYSSVQYLDQNGNWSGNYPVPNPTTPSQPSPSNYWNIGLPTSTWFSVKPVTTGPYAGQYRVLFVNNAADGGNAKAMWVAYSPNPWTNLATLNSSNAHAIFNFPEASQGYICYPTPGCEMTYLESSQFPVVFLYVSGDQDNSKPGPNYRPVIAYGQQ